jgi:hypothetical protein
MTRVCRQCGDDGKSVIPSVTLAVKVINCETGGAVNLIDMFDNSNSGAGKNGISRLIVAVLPTVTDLGAISDK